MRTLFEVFLDRFHGVTALAERRNPRAAALAPLSVVMMGVFV
jgi:hypothetical protein